MRCSFFESRCFLCCPVEELVVTASYSGFMYTHGELRAPHDVTATEASRGDRPAMRLLRAKPNFVPPRSAFSTRFWSPPLRCGPCRVTSSLVGVGPQRAVDIGAYRRHTDIFVACVN